MISTTTTLQKKKRKTIDPRFVPNETKQNEFKQGVTNAIDEFGHDYVAPTAAALPFALEGAYFATPYLLGMGEDAFIQSAVNLAMAMDATRSIPKGAKQYRDGVVDLGTGIYSYAMGNKEMGREHLMSSAKNGMKGSFNMATGLLGAGVWGEAGKKLVGMGKRTLEIGMRGGRAATEAAKALIPNLKSNYNYILSGNKALMNTKKAFYSGLNGGYNTKASVPDLIDAFVYEETPIGTKYKGTGLDYIGGDTQRFATRKARLENGINPNKIRVYSANDETLPEELVGILDKKAAGEGRVRLKVGEHYTREGHGGWEGIYPSEPMKEEIISNRNPWGFNHHGHGIHYNVTGHNLDIVEHEGKLYARESDLWNFGVPSSKQWGHGNRIAENTFLKYLPKSIKTGMGKIIGPTLNRLGHPFIIQDKWFPLYPEGDVGNYFLKYLPETEAELIELLRPRGLK